MTTADSVRRARRMALALAAVLTLAACGNGDEVEDWYRNPSDVLAAEMWKTEYLGLFVTVDDEFGLAYLDEGEPSTYCGVHPTNLAIVTPDGPLDEERVALIEQSLNEADLSLDGSEPQELVPGLSTLDVLPDEEDGLPAPLQAAVAVNSDPVLRDAGVRASPDYETFPMPGRMYFPGNLPGPTEGALPTLLTHGGSAAPEVHVIDSGLVPGLGLPAGIDGEADLRAPDQSADVPGSIDSTVAGHGTFVAGVIRQHSTATVTAWAAPASGEGRFYESDVLEAAQRLRVDGDPTTITNLSLGTVVCGHLPPRPEAEGYPLITLVGTADLLTRDDSVLLAAAGNTAGLGEVDVYPAALTEPQARGEICPGAEPGCVAVEEFLESTRARVASRLVAVGASDLAGPKLEAYSSTASYVTQNASQAGCHTSFYPRGTISYVDQSSSPQFADVLDLEFTDASDDADGSYSLADWCGTSFATAVASARMAEELVSLGESATPADALAELGWKQP